MATPQFPLTFSADKLCSSCRKKVQVWCITPGLPGREDSYPIPVEDDNTSPTVIPLTENEFQYGSLSASNELKVKQPQQCTDMCSDNNSTDSLEEKICQLLVMQSPELIDLRKQLKEQRRKQQKERIESKISLLRLEIEIEIKEYNIKLIEIQQHMWRMKQRKIFFKNMQGINK